jgi:hypothetical protein
LKQGIVIKNGQFYCTFCSKFVARDVPQHIYGNVSAFWGGSFFKKTKTKTKNNNREINSGNLRERTNWPSTSNWLRQMHQCSSH